MAEGSALKEHLIDSAAHMRLADDGLCSAAGAQVQSARADPRKVGPMVLI